jgi:heptosyltransferase-2
MTTAPRPERLLAITYGHVADTIAAIPALRGLRAAYPGTRIDVLCLEAVAPIMRACPYVDQVVSWNDFRRKGRPGDRVEKAAVLAALAARLRGRRYDTTLVLHRSTRTMRALAGLLGSSVRAGVSDGSDGYTHHAPAEAHVESSRDENRRVLDAIGVIDDGGATELWCDDGDRENAASLLGEVTTPLIGIHTGSDWSCQQWLPERFAMVGSALARAADVRLVLTGSGSESGLVAEVARGLSGAMLDLSGRTSLGAFIAVVQRLDLLICVNSAAAAIAEAVGTPRVVLLGPEDPRHCGLESGPACRIVQPGGHRSPGSWCELGRWGVLSGCESPICRGLGGLADLDPQQVIDAALELLPSTAATPVRPLVGAQG